MLSLPHASVVACTAIGLTSVLGPLGCCKKDAPSDSSSAQASASAVTSGGAVPSVGTSAAPGGSERDARKAAYCKRHNELKNLATPKCQACLTRDKKVMAACEAQGKAFQACQKAIPRAKQNESVICMASCGIECNCSLACFEKYAPTCVEAYTNMFECVEKACEAPCK